MIGRVGPPGERMNLPESDAFPELDGSSPEPGPWLSCCETYAVSNDNMLARAPNWIGRTVLCPRGMENPPIRLWGTTADGGRPPQALWKVMWRCCGSCCRGW